MVYISSKIRGRSSVRSSHQSVSGAAKKYFTFRFLNMSFILDDSVIQQQFWTKECDILGGHNILWHPLHIFKGSGPPTLHDLRPWLWLTSKSVAQVCHHQLSFLFHFVCLQDNSKSCGRNLMNFEAVWCTSSTSWLDFGCDPDTRRRRRRRIYFSHKNQT